MLKETGRVVEIENDALWVETIQSSTCSTCVAEKGCGQALLKKIGSPTAFLRVPLHGFGANSFVLNQDVEIGIPEDVIVKGSVFFYLLPLILLLVFSGFAHIYTTEVGSILFGILGLIIGGLIIRFHSYYFRNDKHHQPFIVDTISSQIIKRQN